MPRRAAHRGARVDAGRQRPPELVAVIVACSPQPVTTSGPEHQPAPTSTHVSTGTESSLKHIACGGRGGAAKRAREMVQSARAKRSQDDVEVKPDTSSFC